MGDGDSGDPVDIRGWLRLSPRFTTSGRLHAEDLPRLAALSVRHVVNLALDDHPEALADEAEKLRTSGIAYTHIPVPFDAPTDEHYRQFVIAIEDMECPAHVHCIMNYRVSAFFYRWHRSCGMPEPEARRLMEKIWSPHDSDRPDVKPWRAFVERAGQE